MKTLGEILSTARLEARLTLEQISKATKIEQKYLKALEDNHYQKLPASTFTKGFIRNYAKLLGKNPDELIAIYRRDFLTPTPKKSGPPSATLKRPLFHSFSKSSLLLFSLGFIVFLGYLLFQYRALLLPPPLQILKPTPAEVTTSPLIIEGRTSPDSIVTINDETDLSPNQSGNFLTQLSLSPGEHTLKITATNRFGRTATVNLLVTVLSSP